MVYTHRLYCEACTGIAAYGDESRTKSSTEVVCQSCGKVTPNKPENWIAMTEYEKSLFDTQVIEVEIKKIKRVSGMKVIQTSYTDKKE